MGVMRLALFVMFAAGCATARFQVVPDSDWRTVPPAARAASDRTTSAELATAQHDVELASTALAQTRRMVAAHSAEPRLPPAAVAGAVNTDQDAGAALRRVDAAKADWLRASLAWRQDRLAAAQLHVEVVMSEREARRATLIDANMTGGDSYDVDTYRGQLGHVQERYQAALDRAEHSRAALVQASAELASQKEAFAQLVRHSVPDADPEASLTLTGWTTTLAPGHHRRGLEIVSDSTTYLRRPAL